MIKIILLVLQRFTGLWFRNFFSYQSTARFDSNFLVDYWSLPKLESDRDFITQSSWLFNSRLCYFCIWNGVKILKQNEHFHISEFDLLDISDLVLISKTYWSLRIILVHFPSKPFYAPHDFLHYQANHELFHIYSSTQKE